MWHKGWEGRTSVSRTLAAREQFAQKSHKHSELFFSVSLSSVIFGTRQKLVSPVSPAVVPNERKRPPVKGGPSEEVRVFLFSAYMCGVAGCWCANEPVGGAGPCRCCVRWVTSRCRTAGTPAWPWCIATLVAAAVTTRGWPVTTMGPCRPDGAMVCEAPPAEEPAMLLAEPNCWPLMSGSTNTTVERPEAFRATPCCARTRCVPPVEPTSSAISTCCVALPDEPPAVDCCWGCCCCWRAEAGSTVTPAGYWAVTNRRGATVEPTEEVGTMSRCCVVIIELAGAMRCRVTELSEVLYTPLSVASTTCGKNCSSNCNSNSWWTL